MMILSVVAVLLMRVLLRRHDGNADLALHCGSTVTSDNGGGSGHCSRGNKMITTTGGTSVVRRRCCHGNDDFVVAIAVIISVQLFSLFLHFQLVQTGFHYFRVRLHRL